MIINNRVIQAALILLFLNTVLLNFALFYLWSNRAATTSVIKPAPAAVICDQSCRQSLEDSVQKLQADISRLSTRSAVAVVNSSVSIVPKAKTRQVSYLPLPGSGSTLKNDWDTLSGTDFYFDTKDYPGLVAIYFEANVRLFNANGTAFFRLYDSTHGIGVQGSDINTKSQTGDAVTSGQLSFWTGKNLIKVQAKSLTADTAIFTSGRLKIITEN
jgi:hypothetical protein